MKDLNSFSATGRLTKDSELKQTTGGVSVCSFSIAVNSVRKKGDGWEETASFFDCNIWKDRADRLHPLLLKGAKIALSGELTQQRWEKDGKNLSKIVITVDNIILLDKKKQIEGESPLSDSDIPF